MEMSRQSGNDYSQADNLNRGEVEAAPLRLDQIDRSCSYSSPKVVEQLVEFDDLQTIPETDHGTEAASICAASLEC